MSADHPDVTVTFRDGEVTTVIRALLEYRQSLLYLQGKAEFRETIDDELVRADRMRERITIARGDVDPIKARA